MQRTGNPLILVCSLLIIPVLLSCSQQHSSDASDISYTELIQCIGADRQQFADQYFTASDQAEAQEILDEARDYLIESITEGLIPYWYGTKWDYEGTSQVPGEGYIACGYFVTTILRDAGFNIRRVHWAQQASEYIIKALTQEQFIKRYSNSVPIEKFLASIKEWGPGLYVVGLMDHTGFIYCDGEDVNFLHSSPNKPRKVVSEINDKNPRLRNSAYRVLGKISADDVLIEKWLEYAEI